MTTGQKIKAFREAAGKTREVLADEIGLPKRSLDNIEQGVVAEPKLVDVHRIAAALGKTCADLLPDEAAGPAKAQRGRPRKADATEPPATVPVKGKRTKKK